MDANKRNELSLVFVKADAARRAQAELNASVEKFVETFAAHRIGDKVRPIYGSYEIIIDRISARVDADRNGEQCLNICYAGPRVTKQGKPHATARGHSWEWIKLSDKR